MEFPHLGKHCSEKYCNKLDFLPMKCDACGEIFCSEHFSYQTHSCPSAHRKDFQVPVCPLCSEPVPTPRDVSPDVTVGAHIDQFCRSEKKKIYTNRCTFKTCKKKELVPFSCGSCKRNYCLKHRHTADHECAGVAAATGAGAASQQSLAAQAAIRRSQGTTTKNVPSQSQVTTSSSTGSSSNSSHLAAVQGTMSEDEALARALALSMQEADQQTSTDDDAERDRNASGPRRGITVGGNSGKDKCNLS